MHTVLTPHVSQLCLAWLRFILPVQEVHINLY